MEQSNPSTPSSRPGESALVAIKSQTKAVELFKKPNMPAKTKKKQVILNEDQYIEVRIKLIESNCLIFKVPAYYYYYHFRNLARSYNVISFLI